MTEYYYAIPKVESQPGSAVDIDEKQAAANAREARKPTSGTYQGVPPSMPPPFRAGAAPQKASR